MRDLGFQILFDRVRIKPGKPTTFAVSPESGKYIFGLPGNPVSSFVQCLLLVIPFMAALQGARWEPLSTNLPLKGNYERKNSSRMAHIPVQINPDGTVSCLPYNGSAHQVSLAKAHALGRIPVGVDRIREEKPWKYSFLLTRMKDQFGREITYQGYRSPPVSSGVFATCRKKEPVTPIQMLLTKRS